MLVALGALTLALRGLRGLEPAAWQALPLLAPPVGASALLLFVVPSSPMAQPWPLIGGNVVSCLVGTAVARLVPDPAAAAPLALALAIMAMSLARCLHPPGGAAALLPVVAGPLPAHFALFPLGFESLLLVLLGWGFHRLRGRAYPHPAAPPPAHGTADPPAALRGGFQPADVDAALADMGEAFDIERDDLDRLLRRVEQHALERRPGAPSVGEIMSRDLVTLGPGDTPATARALLLRHRIRSLPVVAPDGRLLGAVGLRELVQGGDSLAAVMAPAPRTGVAAPALGLVPALTDGRSHAAMVVDEEGRLVGLVTQTDLLAALARLLATGAAASPDPRTPSA